MAKKIGKALVVGAGISGIRAALDLAEIGYGVTLIDRAPHGGGILAQLDRQFPSNRCGMCKMLPLVHRDSASQFCLRKGLFHENIDLRLGTRISGIEGEPGNFTVALHEEPTGVDPGRCIGCGLCQEACPVEVADSFNAGLSKRKAIYLPVPHQVPTPFVIDAAACTRCGACVEACPTDAIDLGIDRRGSFRILVVDDEQIVRDSMMAWLEDEGFYVETADSGQTALDRLAEAPFHLMLTDIKMPGMDGVALLEAAQAAHPDLRVLMMTAYATVETAVAAMKIGAVDYLIKPFDPEAVLPKVAAIHSELEAGEDRRITVGAIVLCGGTDYFQPADKKNVYGYGVLPGVITNLELERLLSGTGPTGGRLLRPGDNKPVQKIAWLQCVGSRDIQCDADFCSSICCMIAVKEAMLVKERSDAAETAIFYMDMRAPGKSFQRYRDRAQNDNAVRFVRARVHSLNLDTESGDPSVRYADKDGRLAQETFDLVVLSVGQRPAAGTQAIADQTGIELNPWGFADTLPFSPATTNQPGITVGGAFSGLKDIADSVITASAAALEASRVIHGAGGSLAEETGDTPPFRDVSCQPAQILVALCTCGKRLVSATAAGELARQLKQDPAVVGVEIIDHACTAAGWEKLVTAAESSPANRLVIGACRPYLFTEKLRELGRRLLLDPSLMDVVDLLAHSSKLSAQKTDPDSQIPDLTSHISSLTMAVARLKYADPAPVARIDIQQRALVVGGGIAGMHAALAIADHGYPVDLLEQSDHLGGNLDWLEKTLDGEPFEPFLEATVDRVEKHPDIDLHLETRVEGAFGEIGRFFTTISGGEAEVRTLTHGAVVLATGGQEATTELYGYATSQSVVTQKELEGRLKHGEIDPVGLDAVVMIQCVGSREEPRNYCSRVCCPTALKHALALKEKNPDIQIYILYRDMMATGFSESRFTQARQAGVIFIQYDPAQKPEVTFPGGPEGPVQVGVLDPMLGRRVAIEANLLVLATGIVPRLPEKLAAAYGADTDMDGFFHEAESKWRPVDSLRDGVFACGLALSPRPVSEAVASAGAAAQRCLRILSSDRLASGRMVATVRPSLCSLCQRCIEACPYQARTLVPELDQVVVNPAMCQGCGACAAVCPNDASVVAGYAKQQILEVIDAALQ